MAVFKKTNATSTGSGVGKILASAIKYPIAKAISAINKPKPETPIPDSKKESKNRYPQRWLGI